MVLFYSDHHHGRNDRECTDNPHKRRESFRRLAHSRTIRFVHFRILLKKTIKLNFIKLNICVFSDNEDNQTSVESTPTPDIEIEFIDADAVGKSYIIDLSFCYIGNVLIKYLTNNICFRGRPRASEKEKESFC